MLMKLMNVQCYGLWHMCGQWECLLFEYVAIEFGFANKMK